MVHTPGDGRMARLLTWRPSLANLALIVLLFVAAWMQIRHNEISEFLYFQF